MFICTKATCTVWKEIGKHIMLNLWFTLVSTKMCCKALKLTVHFWASQIRIHMISFLYVKSSTCLKKTNFLLFTWILTHIDMLMLNPDGGQSLPLNGKWIFRLTDSFVQLFLRGLKSMFSDMEPLILFHVSQVHHVMPILSLYLKKQNPSSLVLGSILSS